MKKRQRWKPKILQLTVEIGEHHSSMGTTLTYTELGADGGNYYGVPCPNSFRPRAGKRYRVTWEELPPNPKVRPIPNPWRKK